MEKHLKLLIVAMALQLPPQQFDLVCAGTVQAMSSTSPAPTRFSSRYRVDLDRRIFCEDECVVQWEIAAVHPTILTLLDHHWHDGGGGTDLVTVNRESGEFRMERTTGSGGSAWGSSVAAPVERRRLVAYLGWRLPSDPGILSRIVRSTPRAAPPSERWPHFWPSRWSGLGSWAPRSGVAKLAGSNARNSCFEP